MKNYDMKILKCITGFPSNCDVNFKTIKLIMDITEVNGKLSILEEWAINTENPSVENKVNKEIYRLQEDLKEINKKLNNLTKQKE